jgi:hypothetical protein
MKWTLAATPIEINKLGVAANIAVTGSFIMPTNPNTKIRDITTTAKGPTTPFTCLKNQIRITIIIKYVRIGLVWDSFSKIK